jgi:hypothetical protein
MVDDIDAAYAHIKGHGMDVTAIIRGRIHDISRSRHRIVVP